MVKTEKDILTEFISEFKKLTYKFSGRVITHKIFNQMLLVFIREIYVLVQDDKDG